MSIKNSDREEISDELILLCHITPEPLEKV